jgi:hypothetical protein
MRVQARSLVGFLGMALVLGLAPSVAADEAPIVGVVKSVDTATGTISVESTTQGTVRQVVIYVRQESKVVRFTRSTDPGKAGFSEQASSLADLKLGWTVSVKARHEGDKEVAEIVRVVHEK